MVDSIFNMKKLLYILLFIILSCSVGKDVPNALTAPETVNVAPVEQLVVSRNAALSVFEAIGMAVDWEDPTSDYAQKAVDENKWAVIWFYAEGCAYCDNMEDTTFRDIAVINTLNQYFVTVRLDINLYPAEYYHLAMEPFSDQMTIIPSTVFVSPDGVAVATRGIIPPNEFSNILNNIVNNNGLQEIADKR